MPLVQGGSEEAIRENIARLIREGKSPEEAAAIAYRIARENDLEGSGRFLPCLRPSACAASGRGGGRGGRRLQAEKALTGTI